ncbi:MAG: hypothetical protein NC177_08195 [Ruminococcus flavefaciens]|nr:hypothetical protein [Ruminococcus flavefaciens]
MIVLKILLCVLLAVLGIVMAVVILALALPAAAEVSFIDGKLKYKVKFSFLSLIDSDGKGLLKRKKKSKKSNKKSEMAEQETSFDFEDYNDDDIFPEDDIDDTDIDIDIDIEQETITDELPKETDEDDEDRVRSEKIKKIKEKKSRSAEETQQSDESKPDTPSESKIEKLLNIWDIAGRPLLKIFKGFHVKNVFVDFIVADEDAYKCAINYGIVSGAVYNILAWLGELFTVSYKTVDVQCGFSLKKSQWNVSCKVTFRLYTLVVSGLWFLMTYIFKILLPKKFKGRKSKK